MIWVPKRTHFFPTFLFIAVFLCRVILCNCNYNIFWCLFTLRFGLFHCLPLRVWSYLIGCRSSMFLEEHCAKFAVIIIERG